MDIYLSRHRITYTATGEEPRELLCPQSYCEAEPAFDGAPATQITGGILSTWTSHHTRGNASMTLSFDRFISSPCRGQAQAAAHGLWLWLNTHPEGTLTYDTAFLGLVSSPLVHWQLHATLAEVRVRELDADSSPFAEGAGYHVSYRFNISKLD